MAGSANLFQSAVDQAFSGTINWASDSIKVALLTASASPSLSTWVHYSDLTNEVANGSGYTTGGVALGSKTHVQTAANSWATTWTTVNAQSVGDIIRPTAGNGFLYVCVVAGTTGGSQPTFSTVVGNTTTDGSVTWSCLGESITVWSSAASQWTSSTFSAAYAVIYDAQSGVASTEPLICLQNLGQTLSPVSGTLTLTPPTNGWFWTSPA